MRKTYEIKSKRSMTMVARLIEDKVRNGIAFYGEYDVQREDGDDFVELKIMAKSFPMLTSSLCETVQELVKQFTVKYATYVMYYFAVQRWYNAKYDITDYYPTMEIQIRRKKDL
jgi:hypothetical protein